jgi:hypothetical protein
MDLEMLVEGYRIFQPEIQQPEIYLSLLRCGLLGAHWAHSDAIIGRQEPGMAASSNFQAQENMSQI